MLAAVTCIATVLLAGTLIQRCFGIKGISILSKLTGLILTALAAQMIMTGIQGFPEFCRNPMGMIDFRFVDAGSATNPALPSPVTFLMIKIS